MWEELTIRGLEGSDQSKRFINPETCLFERNALVRTMAAKFHHGELQITETFIVYDEYNECGFWTGV